MHAAMPPASARSPCTPPGGHPAPPSSLPTRADALVLVSHALCPYVQRVAILMSEKGVPFERRDIDLAAKPHWFQEVSPLGKTPVLLVGSEALVESAAICEYIEETRLPRLHPASALQRAQHRGWMEFGSVLLNTIAAFYNAPDEAALSERAAQIRGHFQRLERALGDGGYFADDTFRVVDAVFAPAFRYFEHVDEVADFGFWEGLVKVPRWRRALAERPSVRQAVAPNHRQLLGAFLLARGSALSRRMGGSGQGAGRGGGRATGDARQ